VHDGVIAWRGLKKTRRGPKVQRGLNFKFNFGGVIAERGPEKVERGRRWGSAKAKRGRRWNARKRSAVLNFYPYRTRISSYI
jgi:hypothetical protein